METTEIIKRFEFDCHCHTNRSDGRDTPEQLIANAVKSGVYGLAIVDHDITPPQEIAGINSLEYAKKNGLKHLILGYEFSCDKYVDDVHIIGYNMDWNHPGVKAEVEAAAKSKGDAYEELCQVLTKHGMPIDFERDILCDGGSECKRTRTRDDVQRKHIFECMAKKGYTKTWDEAKLLVRDNPHLNVERRKIDPREAIKLIHAAGGVAVLAHPFLIDERVYPDGGKLSAAKALTREEYIERLLSADDRASSLDGMESLYTYEKTTYKGKMSRWQIRDYIENKYANRVRFFTAGSDYHNDSSGRYIGECGLDLAEFERIF
ncbi:MAG: PHP domain-containing protein [Oligoflexia bacterium]|nr:PHP domain-containing protein [Oligoflexia bacterium]